MVHRCPECHNHMNDEDAHCSLHMKASDLVKALEHARTQLFDRNWPERELHEPVAKTIERIDKLIGPVE